MNSEFILKELDKNKEVFKNLLKGCQKDLIMFRPEPGKWNLLEIICHLCDEEREDFRQRVELTLNSPTEKWPHIDPPAWVSERKYIEQDFESKIIEFCKEREKSVSWLRSLQNHQWDNSYNHPKVGPVSAKLIFVNWLAHDYLHIRQIIKNKYFYLKSNYNVPLDYAGEW